MTEDERQLRDAICADPANDAPRAVYADWLMERGAPLGRFIDAQLRGDEAGAEALLDVAVKANPLPLERSRPLEPLRECFRRGFARTAGIRDTGTAMRWSELNEWSLIENLSLYAPDSGAFVNAVAGRLVSLRELKTSSLDVVQLLCARRPRVLDALQLDALETWFDFTPLVGPRTRVTVGLGLVHFRSNAGVVELSVGRRGVRAFPLERALRALIRADDEVVFSFPMGRELVRAEVAAAMSRVPHRSYREQEMLVIG